MAKHQHIARCLLLVVFCFFSTQEVHTGTCSNRAKFMSKCRSGYPVLLLCINKRPFFLLDECMLKPTALRSPYKGRAKTEKIYRSITQRLHFPAAMRNGLTNQNYIYCEKKGEKDHEACEVSSSPFHILLYCGRCESSGSQKRGQYRVCARYSV